MHTSVDIEALSQEIYNESAFVDRIIEASGRVIVGQNYMISRLLLGLSGRWPRPAGRSSGIG